MTAHFVELGNVLTRGMVLPPLARWAAGTLKPTEQATPTSLYQPWSDPGWGVEQVLASQATAADAAGDQSVARVALVHLWGLPRTCIIGLAGLATTELTIQAALRQSGSSVTQIKSSDAANLETQLIAVRSRAIDCLVFSGPAVSTAQRLMGVGGPTTRVLSKLAAWYNGPDGGHAELAAALAPAIDLQVLPPIREDSQHLDALPTEQAFASHTAAVLAADGSLAALRRAGFGLQTFGQAITAAAEGLVDWHKDLVAGEDVAVGGGFCLVDLGGQYTEMAVVGSAGASRLADDLGHRELLALVPEAPAKGSTAVPAPSVDALLVTDIGRWLPFDWSVTGLGDQLANYLRRPFTIPASWPQVLTAMALGRQRLARANATFRMSPAETGLGRDWRRHGGVFVVSGGYFRHLPGPALALALAIDGLEPLGISEVWCDRWGLAPFLAASGQIGSVDPMTYLSRLATVVSPTALHLDWRRPHEDDILALVTIERQDMPAMSFRIVPGSLMRFPLRLGERAKLTIHPQREHDFGAGAGKTWLGAVTGGLLGLVFDTRGRPIALPPDDRIRQAKLREWLSTLGAGVKWEELAT